MPLTSSNILHLIDTMGPGGAQQVVKTLFERHTHEPGLHLLALRPVPHSTPVNHPGASTAQPAGKYSLATPLKRALHIIQKENIQVLHCHLPKSQFLGWLIKSLYHPEINLVYHEQGDITDPMAINRINYYLAAKKLDGVICCSQHVKNTLLKKAPSLKCPVSVVHNFTRFADILPGDSRSHPQYGQDDPFHVGFAGRYITRKGWKELVMAAAELNDKHGKKMVALHLAGAGPQEKRVSACIRKYTHIIDINAQGFVHQMDHFYPTLDCLCVPSHREPVGMVHLEAMAMGVPVLASNVEGMNELLKHQHNAILFQPKNTESLKMALETIMNNQALREKITRNGLITAQENSYENFEKQLKAFYKDL